MQLHSGLNVQMKQRGMISIIYSFGYILLNPFPNDFQTHLNFKLFSGNINYYSIRLFSIQKQLKELVKLETFFVVGNVEIVVKNT